MLVEPKHFPVHLCYFFFVLYVHIQKHFNIRFPAHFNIHYIRKQNVREKLGIIKTEQINGYETKIYIFVLSFYNLRNTFSNILYNIKVYAHQKNLNEKNIDIFFICIYVNFTYVFILINEKQQMPLLFRCIHITYKIITTIPKTVQVRNLLVKVFSIVFCILYDLIS